MPGIRRSVFNPDGESYVPDTEKFAFQQRGQNMSDWLAQQQLAAAMQMHGEDLADRASGRQYEGNLQRDLQGTYGQRQGGAMDLENLRQQGEFGLEDRRETGLNTRARIANEPVMGQLDFMKSQFNDPNAVAMRQNTANMGTLRYGAAQREDEMNAQMDNLVLGQLRGAAPGAPGAPAAPGAAIGPNDVRAILRKRAGLGEDPGDQIARMTIAKRLADAQENGEDMAPYQAAVSSNDMSKLPAASQGFDRRTMGDYNQVGQAVAGDLDRARKFIRSNNWSIAGNRPEVMNLYNAVLNRAKQFTNNPKVLALIEADVKKAMGEALDENGVFFNAVGSDAMREDLGLVPAGTGRSNRGFGSGAAAGSGMGWAQ
jgi:hypothetical protein